MAIRAVACCYGILGRVSRSRVFALVGAGALALVAIVSAVQVFGPLGVPLTAAALTLCWMGAVALGRRTNRLALLRSDEHGEAVFFGLAGDASIGGEIHVADDSVMVYKRRNRELKTRVGWGEVAEVSVHRKGPLGPAGLVRFDLTDGSVVNLEVDDGQRFAEALADRGVNVQILGWP